MFWVRGETHTLSNRPHLVGTRGPLKAAVPQRPSGCIGGRKGGQHLAARQQPQPPQPAGGRRRQLRGNRVRAGHGVFEHQAREAGQAQGGASQGRDLRGAQRQEKLVFKS